MRETRNLVNTPTVKPTLEIIRSQFEAWRKRRLCRGPIPEPLWQAAVGVCEKHSIYEVSRTLRLNYNGLKNRVTKAKDRSPAVGQGSDFRFVRVDLGAPMPPSECLVEMEAPSGAIMRMSFKGSPRDFDLVELGRVFWREG